MSLPRYTPFSKPLKALEAADLAVLYEVAEGWYVEYKSKVPDIKSVGKSVSSFANTYGGWLFYGVQERDDATRCAGSFPGVPKSELGNVEVRLRNAISTHVHPPPYYETHAVFGPAPDIGLANDRAILVVLVPQGQDAPYVHSKGVIYRRIADASDPKPETDRQVLDLLWERGRKVRNRLKEFLEYLPVSSKGESSTSYAHLFLLSDPLEERSHQSTLSFERFSELMRKSEVPKYDVPLENSFAMHDGYVARQVQSNDPYQLLLTWRYFRSGASVITIPLPSIEIGDDFTGLVSFLSGYTHVVDFVGACRASRLASGWVLDLNLLFHILMALKSKHITLVTEDGYSGLAYAKVHLENVWRRIPFLDTDSYVLFLKKHGMPVIQEAEAFAPPGRGPETLVKLSVSQVAGGVCMEGLGELLVSVAAALGLPFDMTAKSLNELDELESRAVSVQKARSLKARS